MRLPIPFVALLLLATALPLAAAEPSSYTDGFEAGAPAWRLDPGAALDTSRARSGAASLRIDPAQGVDEVSQAIFSVGRHTSGEASVWIYDDMGGCADGVAKSQVFGLRDDAYTGSFVSLGIASNWSSCQYVRTFDWTTTVVNATRSEGWHEIGFAWTPEKVEFRIDGVAVGSQAWVYRPDGFILGDAWVNRHWRMDAVGVAWFDDFSLAGDETPPTTPSEPRYVRATTPIGGDYVVLQWFAPTYDGGPDVTTYRIYRGLAHDAMKLHAEVAGGARSHVDPHMPIGTFYYSLSAVNAMGEGVRSPPVKVETRGPWGIALHEGPRGLGGEAGGTPALPPATLRTPEVYVFDWCFLSTCDQETTLFPGLDVTTPGGAPTPLGTPAVDRPKTCAGTFVCVGPVSEPAHPLGEVPALPTQRIVLDPVKLPPVCTAAPAACPPRTTVLGPQTIVFPGMESQDPPASVGAGTTGGDTVILFGETERISLEPTAPVTLCNNGCPGSIEPTVENDNEAWARADVAGERVET